MARKPEYSRREWLKISGGAVGTSTLLAGCAGGGDETPTDGSGSNDGDGSGSGDGGDGGNGGDGSDGGDGGDGGSQNTWFRRRTEGTPANEIEMSYWSANVDEPMMVSNSPLLAGYSIAHDEWIGYLASDWEMDGDEFHITLRDGHVWTDGTEIVGADLARFFKLERRMTPESDRPDDPIITGFDSNGKTFIATLRQEGVSPDFVKNQFLPFEIPLPPNHHSGGFFDQKLQELKDASTDSAKTSIREEIANFSITLPDGVYSGPYVPEDVSAEAANLRVNPDDARGEQIGWDGLKLVYIGEEVNSLQAVSNGVIDISNQAYPETIDIPEGVSNVHIRSLEEAGFVINYDQDSVPDVLKTAEAHQAIGYVLDREAINQISRNGFRPVTSVPGGMIDPFLQNYLGDVYDMLDRYETNEENLAKAERLMEEAGATKSGGTWHTPDGEPITLEVVSPSWAQWPEAVMGCVSHLNDFGIQAEHTALNSTNYVSRVWSPGNRDFQATITKLGLGGGGPYPPKSYTRSFDRTNTFCAANPPRTMEAPEEIGNFDAPLQEYDTSNIINRMTLETGEQFTQSTQRLAWIFNYNLPSMPIFRNVWGLELPEDKFNWPTPMPENREFASEDHNPIYSTKNSNNMLPHGYPYGHTW
jgi:peptide/nickel transport system substrate-binding protein